MKSGLHGLAVCGLLSLLAACEKAPDLGPVLAERAKPVHRTDGFQAAAANADLLVSGGGSVLVTSTDHGKTWIRHDLPPPAAIIALESCPDGSFAALDFYRRVWLADAKASAWQPKTLDADFNPVALACDPANRLWVVGSYSTVLSSADRGETWQAQPPGEDAILTTIHWLDAARGRIGGEFGTQLVTIDGGKTWKRQSGLPEDFYPYTLFFTDAKHGWSTGIGGAVLRSDDGGASWKPEANASASPMYALFKVDDALYGIGAGGTVLKHGDAQWSPLEGAPHFPPLNGGAVAGGESLLVVGGAGTLGVVPLKSAASPTNDSAPAAAGDHS